jgi:hypothetical protein
MFVRLREERGMAMIVALLVSFVVLLLSTVVVAQSIHAAQSSGYDRERLQSVNAAEAGTNYFYSYLQTTAPASRSCNAVTQTINSAPSTSTFTATPSFYDASGGAMSCPFSNTTYPSSAVINSVGQAGGQAPRTFQTYMRLTPNYGGFSAALFSNSGGLTINNNLDVYGNSGNNGDIYVTSGDFIENNNSNVRGSVYVAAGSATMNNSSQIQGDLWALNAVSVTTVAGSVTSTTSTISNGTIGTNATAAGAITSTVTGTTSPNQGGIANPPTQSFPQVTFDSASWTANGYTINTYQGANACSSAESFVEGTIPAGNYVVRITGPQPCTYVNSSNSTVNMNGNLAIISDWGLNLSQQSNWNGQTGTRSLHFISLYSSPLDCGSGATDKTISTGNNTNFDSHVNVFFYSPCTVSMSNTSSFSGQVFGSPLLMNNQFTITYQPVLVPGVTGIVGFKQDISYVREVV